MEPVSYHPIKPKAKSTLDSLLEEAKVKERIPFAQIVGLSQDDSITEADDDGLTEEQSSTLSRLEQIDSQIQATNPGRVALVDQLYGCLFLESVSPAACGVADTDRKFGLFTDQYRPEFLLDLLASDILSMTYHTQQCKEEVQKWLFFVMSIHSNCMVAKKCEDQLISILQWQKTDIYQKMAIHSYAPFVSDIMRVFVNWGVPQKELVFKDGLIAHEELQPLQMSFQNSCNQQKTRAHRNFRHVFNMLSLWLQARPKYNIAELNQLLLMVCRLFLDPNVSKESNVYVLQIVITSILNCYKEEELAGALPYLCLKLSSLSDHHHDHVYLCCLFTHTTRNSRLIQQRLAYLLLHTAIMKNHPSDDQISDFQIVELCPLVCELQAVYKNDMYCMSSLVVILDRCVGVVGQDEGQRKQLAQLMKASKTLMSSLRDSVQYMDNTKVKGQLIHLCLKWEHAVKAVNLRQKTLFDSFSNGSQTIQVEQLQDQGSLNS